MLRHLFQRQSAPDTHANGGCVNAEPVQTTCRTEKSSAPDKNQATIQHLLILSTPGVVWVSTLTKSTQILMPVARIIMSSVLMYLALPARNQT